jgi:ABC transport system ATP-binding/permease protein
VHFPSATVREALTFSAALRLDASSVSAVQRAALIDHTLDILEMVPIAGRIVSSLSPAEMKRLTIAVELCANPSILFLDEPTVRREGG